MVINKVYFMLNCMAHVYVFEWEQMYRGNINLWDGFYLHRVVGRPDDWRVDSINFYEAEDFIGKEQWAYDDTPSFDYDYDFAR